MHVAVMAALAGPRHRPIALDYPKLPRGKGCPVTDGGNSVNVASFAGVQGEAWADEVLPYRVTCLCRVWLGRAKCPLPCNMPLHGVARATERSSSYGMPLQGVAWRGWTRSLPCDMPLHGVARATKRPSHCDMPLQGVAWATKRTFVTNECKWVRMPNRKPTAQWVTLTPYVPQACCWMLRCKLASGLAFTCVPRSVAGHCVAS